MDKLQKTFYEKFDKGAFGTWNTLAGGYVPDKKFLWQWIEAQIKDAYERGHAEGYNKGQRDL